MMYIVIPYFAGGAKGRELEYAVAGWRRNFCGQQIRIIVIGDYHKVTDSGSDIEYYPCDRVAEIPGQYRPHLDMAHKMLTFMNAFPDEKVFIWVADDCYTVNEVCLSSIGVLKCMPRNLNSFEKGAGTACKEFRADKLKTRDWLLAHGKPIHNYTTHLPRLYGSDALKQILTVVDATRVSYCIEDLYYNYYYANHLPIKLGKETDIFKFGVYNYHVTEDELRKALKEKIWITNSDKGFSPTLVKVLEEHFFGSK